MKVKEFKNQQVIHVQMIIYSADYKQMLNVLNKFGINNIVRDNCYLYFKASLKQLLDLEEAGLFGINDFKLRINCQRDDIF